MKRRIDDIIATLDLNELVSIKKDLEKGGEQLGRLINSRIKHEMNKHDRFCCVCNAKLDPYSVSNFTIIFGPEDMKKRAAFCAIDCLQYFLGNLKDFLGTEDNIFVKSRKNRRH